MIGWRDSCARISGIGLLRSTAANPPKRSGFCDRDVTPLVQREDDKPENVLKRMQEYGTKTEPLRRFYRDRGLVADVEGVGTPEGILAVTRKALGR